MISREADYAIRVILFLSKRTSQKERVSTVVLSTEMDIPYPFLRRIVQKLVDAEMINSRKGKNGGLTLACASSDLSLYDVISAIHHKGICLNKCIEEKDSCERSGLCTVYKALINTQSSLDKSLKEVTFDKL